MWVCIIINPAVDTLFDFGAKKAFPLIIPFVIRRLWNFVSIHPVSAPGCMQDNHLHCFARRDATNKCKFARLKGRHKRRL